MWPFVIAAKEHLYTSNISNDAKDKLENILSYW
jgi:hypothetical protein